MSNHPETTTPEKPRRPWTPWRAAAYAFCAILGISLLWWAVGRRTWSAYQEYRAANRAAEGAAPIGYVGVSLRKTYYDKPPRFFDTAGGRKRLWAAKGPDGRPQFYDVTDAAFEVDKVSGGYGRDSIPGIDYPRFERPGSPLARKFVERHEFYGLAFPEDARGYPRDLLRKVEVLNDEGGGVPFVIVYDRQHELARAYDRRADGRPLTFGTTGYALGETQDPNLGRPVLYDRRTKSLWLPEEKVLVCVNGPLKGTQLPTTFQPQRMTWGNWAATHPQTLVLVGSNRDDDHKPIPSE
jgi:hypothetical protein